MSPGAGLIRQISGGVVWRERCDPLRYGSVTLSCLRCLLRLYARVFRAQAQFMRWINHGYSVSDLFLRCTLYTKYLILPLNAAWLAAMDVCVEPE